MTFMAHTMCMLEPAGMHSPVLCIPPLVRDLSREEMWSLAVACRDATVKLPGLAALADAGALISVGAVSCFNGVHLYFPFLSFPCFRRFSRAGRAVIIASSLLLQSLWCKI
jgi:hypothetical protein